MKQFCLFTVAFLTAGICSVAAQDLIILKNGNVIEAKVMEISPTEIKYKRFEHLDGPTIVIPAEDVLSIRYENGVSENINAATAARQESDQTKKPGTTAIDPDKFIFGINANAGGALGYIWGGPTGTGINIELGKGNFNSEINLMFPSGGFGILATFNGFWPSRIGGFYFGGGIGFSIYELYHSNKYYNIPSVPVGLNMGYKFVTGPGVYFRTGVFVGFDFIGLEFDIPVYFKPDLSIGWTVK